MYDPAIGRFPSVDPLAEKYAFVSPFNYAENEPIAHIDLWGLQKVKTKVNSKQQHNTFSYDNKGKTAGTDKVQQVEHSTETYSYKGDIQVVNKQKTITASVNSDGKLIDEIKVQTYYSSHTIDKNGTTTQGKPFTTSRPAVKGETGKEFNHLLNDIFIHKLGEYKYSPVQKEQRAREQTNFISTLIGGTIASLGRSLNWIPFPIPHTKIIGSTLVALGTTISTIPIIVNNPNPENITIRK